MLAHLTHQKRRAVRLLADCARVPAVAQVCGVCEATIRRWQREPEFTAALDGEVQKRLEDAGAEFDAHLRQSVEAQLAAQRELRAFAMGRIDLPYKRAMELCAVLKEGSRLLDRAGISVKSNNWREILITMRESDENPAESVTPIEADTNDETQNIETPDNPIIFAHSPAVVVRASAPAQVVLWASAPAPLGRNAFFNP